GHWSLVIGREAASHGSEANSIRKLSDARLLQVMVLRRVSFSVLEPEALYGVLVIGIREPMTNDQ
ncbi:MAG: hypothetical protein ACLQGP_12360, partial [Isosphaeraceae bacterium]